MNEFNAKGAAATKTLLNAILRERRDADAVTDHFMFELLDNVATAYIRLVKHAGIAKLAVMLRAKVARDNMVLLGKTSSARPPNIRI